MDGLLQGAIDVLPTTSLAASCKNNITATYTNFETFLTYGGLSAGNFSFNVTTISSSSTEADGILAIKGL